MRLFLGIPLPKDAVEHLQRVRQAVAPHIDKVSWTRPENLHVTLKFLGEVPEPRVAEVASQVSHVTGPAFRLHADAMECFPPRGGVRIVAVAFAGEGLPRLIDLRSQLELAGEPLGFPRERRPYRPHATLARPRGVLRPQARKIIEDRSQTLWPGPPFTVTEYVLFESRQVGQAREYIAAAHVPLN